MATIGDICSSPPDPARGIAVTVDGVPWRFVVELADPSAGSAIAWHDVTSFWRGHEYARGADSYLGKYRASVATIELWSDDDSLAPWNSDTSSTFGVHVDLGPGVLIRCGLVHESSPGVIDNWNARWTLKVEEWGDASYSRGKRRRHVVTARDTLTSLVNQPMPASTAENWSNRVGFIVVQTGWQYGLLLYGATTIAGAPVLLMPDRPAAATAINELDATCDPAGTIWYTDRYGHLVVRPQVGDTFHADRFAAGAGGTPWVDGTPVHFAWYACDDDSGDTTQYAIDFDAATPFGVDENELSVVNHVKVISPGAPFDDDNPVSVERFDRKTYQAAWIVQNDEVAAAILALRSFATMQARPLHTTKHLLGFDNAAGVDFGGPITIVHQNRDDLLQLTVNGWVRSYVERIAPHGCDIDWSMTITVDLDSSSTSVIAALRPVESLRVVGVTDTMTEFAWHNPAQDITPTHTQLRLLNPASIWGTIDYAGDNTDQSLLWSGLSPSTTYEFQVRHVRIVDGVVVQFSPTRSVSVTTAEPTIPDVDVDGDDGTITGPPPDDPDCIVEYEIQRLSLDGTTWATIASGVLPPPDYVIEFDASALAPERYYRTRTRDVCDDVPGEWVYGNEFVVGCIPPAQLGVPPFSDAALVAYFPQVCPPDHVEEAVTNTRVTLGPAFDRVQHIDTRDVMWSFGQGSVGYGAEPTLLDGAHAATIAARVRLGEQPTSERTLFEYGGLRISCVADSAGPDPDAAGVRFKGRAFTASGTTLLDGPTIFGLDTVLNVAMTHDVGTGDLRLLVNAVLEDIDAATPARIDTTVYSIGLPADSWITDCAVWDRVLADSELPGYVAPPVTVTINQKAGQTDPSSGTPLLFEAVFSEAVTGFVGTDVAIAGTAGATVAAVSTLDNITYTVAVSGMSTSGTVIATIPAAAATSVALPLRVNEASTSTDNTITWNVPTVPIEFVGGVGGFTFGVDLPATLPWLPGDYALVSVWNTVAGTLTVPAWLTRLDTAAGGSGNPGLYGGWLADGLGLNTVTGGGANAILKPGSYLPYTGTENGHFHTIAVYRNVSSASQIAQLVKESLAVGNTAVGPINVASDGAGVLHCLANTGATSPANATHFRFATGVERVKTENSRRADRVNDVLGASTALSFNHDGVDPSGLNVPNHCWAVSLTPGGLSYAPVNSISYVGAGTAAAVSAGSTLTVPLPAGLAAGDVIVCAVRGQENPGLPYWAEEAGWAMVQGVTLGKRVTTLFVKRATGSDTNPTFDSNHGAGVPKQGMAFAFRNVAGMIWAEHQGGNTMTPVRNTSPVAGTVAIAAAASDFYGNAAVGGTANGYTQRGAVGTADGSGSMALATKTIASAGTTIGYPVWTANNASFMGSTLVLLVPN